MTTIYDENVEWVFSSASAAFNSADGTSPHTGVIDLHSTAAAGGDVGQWKAPTQFDPGQYFTLSIWIQKAGIWAASSQVSFFWLDKNGAQVGNAIIIKDGTYGFSTANAAYQNCMVPMTDFAMPFGSQVQYLAFTVGTHTTLSFFLDTITLSPVATNPCDKSSLLAAAKCYLCLTAKQIQAIKTYLWCQNVTSCNAPVGPDNFAVSTSTMTTMTVTWTQPSSPNAAVTRYLVQWGTSNGNYNLGSATVAAGTLSYTITGLTANTTYFVKITAYARFCPSATTTGGSGTTTTPNGLLNNLVHYYDFQAFNANPGINDLVGTANTGSFNGGADLSINAGGIINSCVACTGAGTVNGLAIIPPSPFDMHPLFAGDGSITLSCWVWLDLAGAQTAGFPMTLSLWDAAGGSQYYFIFVNNANSIPTWRMKNNAAGTVDLTWGAAISRQAWHLIVCGYDGTLGKSFLSVDNGALIYSGAFTPNGLSNNGYFCFFQANSQNNEWAGRNDECAIWAGRALTQANINNLWNGGNALPLSGFTV